MAVVRPMVFRVSEGLQPWLAHPFPPVLRPLPPPSPSRLSCGFPLRRAAQPHARLQQFSRPPPPPSSAPPGALPPQTCAVPRLVLPPPPSAPPPPFFGGHRLLRSLDCRGALACFFCRLQRSEPVG